MNILALRRGEQDLVELRNKLSAEGISLDVYDGSTGASQSLRDSFQVIQTGNLK